MAAPQAVDQEQAATGEQEAQRTECQAQAAPAWLGASVRRCGRVNHLNQCTFPTFIELGELELAGEQVEQGLLVLEVDCGQRFADKREILLHLRRLAGS